jgi:hypothetical protein
MHTLITIYTVNPVLKGTSIQQIVVNQPYIQSNLSKRVHLYNKSW